MKTMLSHRIHLLSFAVLLCSILLCACDSGRPVPDSKDVSPASAETQIEEEVLTMQTPLPSYRSDPDLLLHFGFDTEQDSISPVPHALPLEYTLADGILAAPYEISYVFNHAQYQDSFAAPRVDGVSGQALKFDGYSTSLTCGAVTVGSDSLTVSAWIAPRTWDAPGNPPTAILEQCDEAAGCGFRLGFGAYGKLHAAVGVRKDGADPSGNRMISVTLDEYRLNLYEWNWIALSLNGETRTLTLYLNGEVVYEQYVSGSYAESDANLLIGRSAYGQNVFSNGADTQNIFETSMFGGLADELCIFRRAMSKEELLDCYRAYLDENGAAPVCSYSQLMPSYDEMKNDVNVQKYHLMSYLNAMGEVISPFYYNGMYHIFCQRHLNGPYWNYAQWGHFVSEDMLTWTEVFPAISPSDDSRKLDLDHSFSGNAVLDADGNPWIFFTGVSFSISPLNRTSYARPVDLTDPLLLQWKKSNQLVIPHPAACSTNDFRDPFLYTEDGYAYMLIGSNVKSNRGSGYLDTDPVVMVYKAPLDDLTNWTELGIAIRGDREAYPALSFNWELPEMYLLSNDSGTIKKYMMAVSPHPSAEIGCADTSLLYWLGDFDTETGVFTPEQPEPLRFDSGNITTAISTAFVDPVSSRTVSWSVIHGHYSFRQCYDHGYATLTSLARELALNDDGTLRIRPLAEYDTLHADSLVSLRDTSADAVNEALSQVHSRFLHVKMTVDPRNCTKFGLNLKASLPAERDQGERVSVFYEPAAEALTVDASHSTVDITEAHPTSTGTVSLTDDGLLELNLFLDNSTIEVFANDHLLISSTCYSTKANADGMLFWFDGGEPLVKQLDVWQMQTPKE